MTREERHIAVLNRMLENMDVYDSIQPTAERKKAIKAAIQALSQEPTVCDIEQIRAEIERLHYHPKLDFIKNDDVVEMALDIIDKYKGDKE